MRVPRTFVFLDLSGFTNYTAAYGDDAAGRILGTFRTLVREVASERGVRVAKWLGDGCMIVSVDQMAAIEFVMDLEQRASSVCAPLTLRAGIASGHALLFEGDDYIGSAVNMAARLCDYAQGFDVLMPSMHLDHLPGGRGGRAVRRDRAARLPGRGVGGAPDGCAHHGDAPRHRRALDAQPVRLTPAPTRPASAATAVGAAGGGGVLVEALRQVQALEHELGRGGDRRGRRVVAGERGHRVAQCRHLLDDRGELARS